MKTSNDDDPIIYDFRYWPEIIGVFMVLAVIAFLFTSRI